MLGGTSDKTNLYFEQEIIKVLRPILEDEIQRRTNVRITGLEEELGEQRNKYELLLVAYETLKVEMARSREAFQKKRTEWEALKDTLSQKQRLKTILDSLEVVGCSQKTTVDSSVETTNLTSPTSLPVSIQNDNLLDLLAAMEEDISSIDSNINEVSSCELGKVIPETNPNQKRRITQFLETKVAHKQADASDHCCCSKVLIVLLATLITLQFYHVAGIDSRLSRQQHINDTSRHKLNETIQHTPPGFWDGGESDCAALVFKQVFAQSNSAPDSKDDHFKMAKRKQVKNACVNCQRACKKCDDNRPCSRCIKYGVEETCVNSSRKERRRGGKRGPYRETSRNLPDTEDSWTPNSERSVRNRRYINYREKREEEMYSGGEGNDEASEKHMPLFKMVLGMMHGDLTVPRDQPKLSELAAICSEILDTDPTPKFVLNSAKISNLTYGVDRIEQNRTYASEFIRRDVPSPPSTPVSMKMQADNFYHDSYFSLAMTSHQRTLFNPYSY